MTWSDLLRCIVFGQGAIVLILSVIILVRYTLLLRLSPNPRRSLPWHVCLVSLSYAGASVFICLELWWRIGDPITYRTPFALAIFALGDAALLFMIAHLIIQRRYLNRIRARLEGAGGQ